MSKKNTYDKTIDLLVERLEKSGRYIFIEKNVFYNTGKYAGELDVNAVTTKGTFHYYEVKSTDHLGAFKRAQKQFNRYIDAFPERRIKGIYVTPTRVCRLRYSK